MGEWQQAVDVSWDLAYSGNGGDVDETEFNPGVIG
jgi:hypothetical protein